MNSTSQKPLPLTVEVLRPSYDATNSGVTSQNNRVILIPLGVAIDVVMKTIASATIPVLKVVSRNLGGRTYLHAEPVTKVPAGHVGYMAGGNYVVSSDSRYREFVGDYPISVHDRTETTAYYNSMD
jgi:hypothetical protein